MLQERFQHFGETVSRHFTDVLVAVIKMSMDFIKPLDREFKEVPKYIRENRKYWPHFKDCIGIIDGTHIAAVIPENKKVPYIGRKGYCTQNVMAVCDFNMLFTFAWGGWEGPEVDGGYPNMKGYLASYKGERYHLPEFRRGSQPRGPHEFFNHAHSSLRTIIERTFGVWKAKWRILSQMPSFSFSKQVAIVIASMMIHNFIRRTAIIDDEFQRYDENLDLVPNKERNDNDEHPRERYIGDDNEMGVVRDRITSQLYNC
ncbi:uncharacterized protein LOC132309797 [Cornus florida]|uniref:uncharacterized protein LOC132309797 n=1 Tax=Cornus florida TaxID=4283 RepID=UPI00289EF904|nr:uncharacterized protein LOC132309797 [Cornus florida]